MPRDDGQFDLFCDRPIAQVVHGDQTLLPVGIDQHRRERRRHHIVDALFGLDAEHDLVLDQIDHVDDRVFGVGDEHQPLRVGNIHLGGQRQRAEQKRGQRAEQAGSVREGTLVRARVHR